MINLSKLSTNGKFLFLAYDHGLEHGPTDFNDTDVDPNYILDIAYRGKYNAVILQKGIAEKYYLKSRCAREIPLIVKLSGKTNLVNREPYSAPLCTVEEALKLDAKGVGYTIYVGSEFEPLMLKEFSRVVDKAHKRNLPVIAWMYPRGRAVKGKEKSKKILAYAARIGLELGADILKMHYTNDIEDMKWVTKSAGACKVIISGGPKIPEKEFLKQLKNSLKSGCKGAAVGRNIWQNPNPLDITEKIKRIINHVH